MRYAFHRTVFASVLLSFLLIVSPLPVSGDHQESLGVVLPGMAVSLDDQAYVLRPESRPDADLSGLPYYTIDVRLDLGSATLTGEERVVFTNPASQPLDSVVFRLLPNATSIYAGGSLTVQSVTRDQVAVPWAVSSDRTALTVSLVPALAPGSSVELGLAFAGVIPTGSNAYNIYHHSSSVTSLAGWYPVLAPYDNGWDTTSVPAVGDANHFSTGLYDVTLVAPASHVVVSTGTTLHSYRDGELRVWRILSGPARGFAIALSDRFQLHTTEVEGVKLNYYALPSARGRDPQDALRIAADSFRVFNARFAPYPYEEFDIVETLVSVGGYEFAGMVYVEQSLRTAGSLEQLRFIVSHEVAHEWWYALVGSDPVAEPWLDESLATYSVAVYLEDVFGPEAARGMVAYFRRESGSPTGLGIGVSALDFSTWSAYRGPVYYRGALFVDALRSELGDEAFFALLADYARTYRYDIATTPDLTAMAEKYAGRSLDDVYQVWFGVPEPGVQS